MISFTSVTTLAYTKLKTRRVRLIIALTIISLLFSLLVAGTLITTGFYNSFNKFSSEGLSGRYIVGGSGDPAFWGETEGTMRNPAFIARAESLYKQQEEKKQAKAEELGINYQSNPNDSPIHTDPDGEKRLNVLSPIGMQIIAEHRATLRQVNEQTFINQFGSIKPEHVYKAISPTLFGPDAPKLKMIKDGRELTEQQLQDMPTSSLKLLVSSTYWRLFDSELLEPFLLKGQSLEIGTNGSLPIIAPYDAAEKLLGLSPLPVDATAAERKQHLEILRDKAAGLEFQLCYRNHVSQLKFTEAFGQQASLATNGDKEDYVKPNVLLDLPKKACGPVIVASDTRSEEEKELDRKWQQFERHFGQKLPHHQLLTFRIVGLKQDFVQHGPVPTTFTFMPDQMINVALGASVGQGWLSPLTLQSQNKAVADLFKINKGSIFDSTPIYFAEFANSEQAKQALFYKSCIFGQAPVDDSSNLLDIRLQENDTPACSRDGRPFMLQPFGGNAILIDQLKDRTQLVLLALGGVIAGVAALVLMGMLGRIIADSRRETAVFRALGATRLSIMQIYFTYTWFLIGWIILLSLSIGLLLAMAFEAYYGPGFSVTAAVAFAIDDLNQKFSLIGFDWFSLALIAGIIIAAGLLAAIIPILRSVGRNPMKDMREE